MILIKQCEVFAPEKLGIKDVLIAGEKIIGIEDEINLPEELGTEVIYGEGLRMIPGLIDCHVHIAGAGGEGGPATRTPEMNLSQMIEGGITTVIGCLGTDGMTRSVESILMKAKALRAEGVSCWMLTGAYQVPTPTITGDVGRDIALIDEIIGVGEVSISDHRSSNPTIPELAKLCGHARVGGMLGGKAGVINFHMGDAKKPFEILQKLADSTELSLKQFLPTHINRNDYIFEDAKEYGKQGYIDITASSYPYFPEHETKPSKAIRQLTEAGVPLEHITMSSDGCGSLPDFDENGNLVKLETGQPLSIFRELIDTVVEEGIPLEQALKVVTSNPALIFRLPSKGYLKQGYDADITILDGENRVYHVLARGQFFMKNREIIKKGAFE